MIYGDQDGMFREENEIFAGQRYASDQQQQRMARQNKMLKALQMIEFQNAIMIAGGQSVTPPPQSDVWSNFQEKLNDTYVKSLHF